MKLKATFEKIQISEEVIIFDGNSMTEISSKLAEYIKANTTDNVKIRLVVPLEKEEV